MKISVNTIREQGYDNIVSLPTDELVARIGVQLGAVEEVIHLGPRYDGIVVARIVSCEKHPDADRLNICMIDDGGRVQGVERDENDNVQVVCGAPNAREGLLVAWIPPGITVPSTINDDPFVLESRAIRGQLSNGMLASPKELDISDDHEGILEIDAEQIGEELSQTGTAFKRLYGLDDVIIDIENKMFTHRPDCFGILGVAREIAGIQQKSFTSPDWYTKGAQLIPRSDDNLEVVVRNEIPELVKRFMVVAMSGVVVGKSPLWLQSFLTRLGVKSINNVVDVTNYIMLLTGQPLHAYDYDKLLAKSGGVASIVARKAQSKESLALLNGKTLQFDNPAVLIATDKVPVGVGGIMGGSETEVDKSTTRIVVECANFDMYNIRKTSMKYGLFTDAVTRFNKGQSPFQNDRILAKAAEMLHELTGAQIASKVYDDTSHLPSMSVIAVGSRFINERLGVQLSVEEMKSLLENVEFVVSVEGEKLLVDYPFWRTDIEIPEDIVEEVGRLHGYDKIELQLPVRDIVPATINEMLQLKQHIRDILSRAGANELLTYSFVHGKLLEKVGQQPESAFRLSNALSPELQYYRLSLTPSLLDKVHPNIKSGYGQFGLFEMNKVHCNDYLDKDGLPIEDDRLAFVFAADDKVAKGQYQGSPYYQARRYVQYLLGELGFTARFEPATDYQPDVTIARAAHAPFESKRSAIIRDKNGEFLGEIGEFRSSVRKSLKLPEFTAGFELDLSQLLKLTKPNSYEPLSRFPSTEQDISLQVDADTTYEQVFDTAYSVITDAEVAHGYRAKLSPVDIYQFEGAVVKNITLRVTMNHPDRTLVTEEVSRLMDAIAFAAAEKLAATRN